MRATRAIIRLDAFRYNLRLVRSRVGSARKICVPVKADGYGHGAVPLAKTALEEGAEFLAVATADEGAELREAGITAPILLLSIPLPEEIPELIVDKLIPLAGDRDFVRELAATAEQGGEVLSVHLKVDTGMGRIGCPPESAAELAALIAGSKHLKLGGVATHLAVSDSLKQDDVAYTKEQLTRFGRAVEDIKKAGIDPGLVHTANTGALAFHEDAFFDMVRPGILLYGYAPAGAEQVLPVKPVMELVSQIMFIKQVKKGETVSYGRIWTADRDTTIATIPVGYGDGLPRRLSGDFQVRINDAWYPLVGRICMDQCMADLGPNTAIRRWDSVSFFGADALSAADLAAKLGTISYEITCGINKRVPRIYVDT
ncbi:alanine racemase [Treponema primitia]|uniref:alanine racemase n=1 Tax=Treponema primitia TaxID=88058 RepID=UPI00397FC5E8